MRSGGGDVGVHHHLHYEGENSTKLVSTCKNVVSTSLSCFSGQSVVLNPPNYLRSLLKNTSDWAPPNTNSGRLSGIPLSDYIFKKSLQVIIRHSQGGDPMS